MTHKHRADLGTAPIAADEGLPQSSQRLHASWPVLAVRDKRDPARVVLVQVDVGENLEELIHLRGRLGNIQSGSGAAPEGSAHHPLWSETQGVGNGRDQLVVRADFDHVGHRQSPAQVLEGWFPRQATGNAADRTANRYRSQRHLATGHRGDICGSIEEPVVSDEKAPVAGFVQQGNQVQ